MRRIEPFEMEIETLGKGGVGIGRAPDGAPMKIRGSPPGARVHVIPMGKSKGEWSGRRTAMIRPAVDHARPRCAVFGRCGGCTLQELGLSAQRAARRDFALREISVAFGSDVSGLLDRPVAHAGLAYAYRNRVELTFGDRRWVTEDQKLAGESLDGRFLGFHAPGRFDRVVDAERCELVDEGTNAAIAAVREISLEAGAPVGRDPRTHQGFWRHLLLRSACTGERLAVLYTATPTDGQRDYAMRVGAALMAIPGMVGVQWCINDEVADVARGRIEHAWGADRFEERLLGVRFRLSATSFFQTSTPGAEALYREVGEAAGTGETLLDLYSGTGAIGLCLADRFRSVVGIEEHGPAVEDARANAELNGIRATFTCAKVESALEQVVGGSDTAIVVDPPRAGLHPSVAAKLAETRARVLVYVACNPASLGRDAALMRAGWRLDAIRIVDLFPQTGHVEAIGRFVPV